MDVTLCDEHLEASADRVKGELTVSLLTGLAIVMPANAGAALAASRHTAAACFVGNFMRTFRIEIGEVAS
jgi:hypothetical protein